MRRLWLLAALAVALASCRRPPALPNVVLVSMDTVRADHVSVYGHSVRTTPRLEQLAQRSTTYARAVAAGAWTVPSHASMFTGRNAFEHGAHTLPPVSEEDEQVRPLDPSHVTLAETLKELGYATGGIVANAGYLAPRWGLNQGFDEWTVVRGRANVVTTRAIEWLDGGRTPDKPFFLFVNYMDAHRPYNAEPIPGLLPREVAPDGGRAVGRLYKLAMPNDQPVPPELVQQVSDQYDTGIAHLDAGVGALLDALEARGLLEDALVIVTSDHGEFLGEHALVEHSKDVYQEVLAIPMIVKAPRQRDARREERMVSHVDLARMILGTLPRDAAAKVEARYPLTIGSHPVVGENYYARLKDLYGHPWSTRFHRVRTALYDGPLKLIASSDGKHELYDLAKDPREQHDLAAERASLVESLVRGLELFKKSRGTFTGGAPPRPPKLSPEEIEELRALGYVGEP